MVECEMVRVKIMACSGIVMLLIFCAVGMVSADIVVRPWHKDSIILADLEATFGPAIPNSGLRGKLYKAVPLDACSPLDPGISVKNDPGFLVVESGKCDHVTKLHNAQNAGFAALLLYNAEDEPEFITMEGNATDITIYAASVSRFSGMTLLREAEDPRADCYLIPSATFHGWSRLEIAAVIFVSICVVFLALSIFICVKRNQLHERQRALESRPILLD